MSSQGEFPVTRGCPTVAHPQGSTSNPAVFFSWFPTSWAAGTGQSVSVCPRRRDAGLSPGHGYTRFDQGQRPVPLPRTKRQIGKVDVKFARQCRPLRKACSGVDRPVGGKQSSRADGRTPAPPQGSPDQIAALLGAFVVMATQALQGDAQHDLARPGRPAQAFFRRLQPFEKAATAQGHVA